MEAAAYLKMDVRLAFDARTDPLSFFTIIFNKIQKFVTANFGLLMVKNDINIACVLSVIYTIRKF